MSTCLIITQGNKMYIGADSACSVKTPDEFRRYSDDMQKLFRLNEQIFFCSGNMSKVYECVDWIYNHFTHSICIEDLKNYLINNCNERLDEYYNIEILIADYKANVVHQLSQYNNFKILTYPYSEQLRIICGGYKTKDTFIMAKKNILLKQSIYNIYHNTYQAIADECVGGYLYLYSSPTDFHKVKIIEDNIKYVCMDNELHLLTSEFVTSGFINGTQIIGGDIYSQNYTSTTGCHIDLTNGHFSLGGGALKWDGTTLSISSPDILTTSQITQITKDTITTSYIKSLNLTVGNEIQMGENATISWKQISDANSQVTTITKDTVDTSYVNALNITAKKVSTDWVYAGNIKAGQIKTGSIVSTNGYTNINLDNGSFSFANGNLSYSNSTLSIVGNISANKFDIQGSTISIETGQDKYTILSYDENWNEQKISSTSYGTQYFNFQSDYDVMINNIRISGYMHLYQYLHADGDIHTNGKLTANSLRAYSLDAHTVTIKGGQAIYSGDSTVAALQGKSSYLEVAALNSAYAIPWTESDIKLKKNIANSEINALDKIKQINFYQFDWKNKGYHEDLGIIANELKDIISNSTIDVALPEGSEYDSLLNVNTYTMLIYALKGIKELIAENEKLYEMINKL